MRVVVKLNHVHLTCQVAWFLLFFRATLQDKLRDNLVVKGDKNKAISELEAGRRTIVRDPDDPTPESDMQDSLYVGRQDDLEEELRAAYAAVRCHNPRRGEL